MEERGTGHKEEDNLLGKAPQNTDKIWALFFLDHCVPSMGSFSLSLLFF